MDKNDENNVIIVQEALVTGINLMAIYVLLGESVVSEIFARVSPGIILRRAKLILP